MSWLSLTTDSAANSAGAKVLQSYAKNSTVAAEHDTYPVYQNETVTTTVYRGLTESAAKTLADSLKADTVKAVYLYGQLETTSEAVVVVLSGTRTNVRAERADESAQWQTVAESTAYSYTADATAWATTLPSSSSAAAVVSESTQTSLTYVGYHFHSATTVTNVDGTTSYFHPKFEKIWQKEETTTKTVRSSAKSAASATAEEVSYYANFDGNGGVEVRTGTRTVISSAKLPNNRGYLTTTTTTVFTPVAKQV